MADSFKSSGVSLIERPPQVDPKNTELLGVVQWIDRALGALIPRLNNPSEVRLVVLHAAPGRPREGQIVYADGTDWDPGSGAGFYGYTGAAWVLLG